MSCFEFDGIVSKAVKMTRLRVEVWGIGGGGGGKGMEERPGLGCGGICDGAGCSGVWGIMVLLTGGGCIDCIGIGGGALLLAGGAAVCCCGTGAGLGVASGGRDAHS